MNTPQIHTHPRARAYDPDTSHAAAARAETFAGKHRARIAASLESAPLEGMTAGEIGAACGLTVEQVDRRITEMHREGLLAIVGTRFCSVKGSHMRAWRLSA